MLKDDGLLAVIQLDKLHAPAPRVLDVMRVFLGKMNNEVALNMLHVDKENYNAQRLVQIVDAEKAWGHQFVDRHNSLRKLFEKVGGLLMLARSIFAIIWLIPACILRKALMRTS